VKWGDVYWPIWLGVMTITMGVPEVYALITNTRNTLSDWVWDQLNVTTEQQLPWTAAHYLVFGAWITVVSWLTWHFFFRRFT
jgi:hypothetical protein